MSGLDKEAIEMLKALPSAEGRLFDRLVDIYKTVSPELIRGIELAISDSDPQALVESSHSLKSSSAQLGATDLSSVCQQLEIQGRNRDLHNSQALLKALHDEFENSVRLLEMECADQG